LLADYAVLVKPRVSLMVIITAAAGFYLGSLASGIPPFNWLLVKAPLASLWSPRAPARSTRRLSAPPTS
jgi:heme O synthase-like polyprenyltransferase